VEDNENGIKAAIKSGANVLKVNSVEEVNYNNIKNKIREIEEGVLID
jgi:beta-phosphoglucomutase-like phosphatase (HAD superfamily)